MSPNGKNFRTQDTLRKIPEYPRMLRMMHTYADVKIAEDLNLSHARTRANAQTGSGTRNGT